MKSPFIISVAGARSGVGKTSLCAILLSELKGFGAIKFTKTPLHAAVIEDSETLREKGKDTERFISSGAEKVVWIKAPYHKLAEALSIALARMAGLAGIVVEGNSPVDFLDPHLILFTTADDREVKPSAVRTARKADIVVINSDKCDGIRPAPSAPGQEGCQVFRIDLLRKRGELNEFLELVKKRIAQADDPGQDIG